MSGFWNRRCTLIVVVKSIDLFSDIKMRVIIYA